MPITLWTENGNLGVYTDYGCSPQIQQNTIDWLNQNKQNLASFDLALYLFNNNAILDALANIRNSGWHVRFITELKC